MKRPRGSTVCIVILSSLCAVLLWHTPSPNSPPPPPPWRGHIIFGDKSFFDHEELGQVEVTGALAGKGVAFKDNATTIACYKDRGECLLVQALQIGDGYIGRLLSPTFYPIIKWDTTEIVATSGDDPTSCIKETISLDRPHEAALFVQQPVNADRLSCQHADSTIYKWTIEDPPWTNRKILEGLFHKR